VEIIPVSSEKAGGGSSETKRTAPEEARVPGQEEAEVNSEKVEAVASDAVGFPENFGDPTDLTSTPRHMRLSFSINLLRKRSGILNKICLTPCSTTPGAKLMRNP
jgi:hypothetical protein